MNKSSLSIQTVEIFRSIYLTGLKIDVGQLEIDVEEVYPKELTESLLFLTTNHKKITVREYYLLFYWWYCGEFHDKFRLL